MDLFWEMYQQRSISDASGAAGRAESKAGNLQDEVYRLSRRVDSLALGAQAMWELLCEHSQLDDYDIQARMLEIDARDGNVDGRMGSGADQCPQCQRPFSRKHNKCLYCGHEGRAEDGHVFGG